MGKHIPVPCVFMNLCMIRDGDKVLMLDKVKGSVTGLTFPGGHVERDEPFADAVVREVFVSGTEPTDMSRYWVVPTPPSTLHVALNDKQLPEITFQPEETFILYRLYREDAFGNSVFLQEWPGHVGMISYVDVDVQAGNTYSYYVIMNI